MAEDEPTSAPTDDVEPEEPKVGTRKEWIVSMDENVYSPPVEIKPGDKSALGFLDVEKLVELREAFNVIDLNGDGLIDFEDLKGIFLSMGSNTDEDTIAGMIDEGQGPIDFEGFATLMCMKTIDIDTEEDLIKTFALWDKKSDSGLVNEDLLLDDLINRGERMSEKEAFKALEEAPYSKDSAMSLCSPMIEYPAFCKKVAGFRRKPKPGEPATPLRDILKVAEEQHEAMISPPEK